MDLKSLDLSELRETLDTSLSRVSDRAALESFKHEWLGKQGIIKSLFQQLREIDPAIKPKTAAGLNEIKQYTDESVQAKEQELAMAARAKSLNAEYLDMSLPGLTPSLGHIHPITAVEHRIAAILRPFGFRIVPGPEVETEYYCFDALNIPPHHPARDMQDTFYTSTGHLMRTHTTSVQSRVLEREKGSVPVKVVSIGRCYRNETEDASHQSMFHQFELVWVDQGLTLSNLMALTAHIIKGLYGKRRKVRFVPKFYPYTEPSVGPQIDCGICRGAGCSFCGGSGWVTVGGSGMVHRNVLKEFGYDPDRVTGFAFGLGTGRLAAQACGFSDGRKLYENDLRVFRKLL